METDAIALDIKSTDLNGDGRPDLLFVYTRGSPFYVGHAIQVLINNGNGTFRDESVSRLPYVEGNWRLGWVRYLHLVDIDGDCDLDILEQYDNDYPALYTNDGQGVFTLRTVDNTQPWTLSWPQPESNVLPWSLLAHFAVIDNGSGVPAFISSGSGGKEFYYTPAATTTNPCPGPAPDIKANSSDGPVTLGTSDPLIKSLLVFLRVVLAVLPIGG